MRINWLTLMTKLVFWLSAEIILGLLGLDDLADCGEYIFSRDPPYVIGSCEYPVKRHPDGLPTQSLLGGL
jgi:hypothetical protein